jgi:hypothetical protein
MSASICPAPANSKKLVADARHRRSLALPADRSRPALEQNHFMPQPVYAKPGLHVEIYDIMTSTGWAEAGMNGCVLSA